MVNDAPSDIQGFDDQPAGKSRISKKWIVIPAVTVALLGGASLLIPQLLDQAKYKALIKDKVAEATGYTVDWKGDIGLWLLPLPSVHLNELTLSNGTIKILSLKEADVRVEMMPLLSKKIEIASVNLIEPDVTLTIDKNGNSTWMTQKLSKESDGKADGETDTAKTEDAAPEITLNSLKITNGRLLFKNQQAGSEQLIENLNANLNAESLTGPYAVKGDVTYAKKDIEFDLKAGKLDGNEKIYPVQGKVKFPDIDVEGEYSGVIAAPSPLKVDGELTVSAKDLEKTITAFSGSEADLPDGLGGETSLKAKLAYDGNVVLLDQMRLSVGDLAYSGSVGVKDLSSDAPPLAISLVPDKDSRSKSSSALVAALSDLSVKGSGTFANNVVKINTGTIGFRGQTISASGTYALPKKEGQRPVIDFTVKADKLNVDELTGTVSKVTGGTGNSETAKKSDSAAPTGMSLPFDGHLSASIGSLVTGGKTYSPLNADIVSKGNALTINSLNVGIASGTTLTAKGRVGNLSALSDFDLTASGQTADADALMKALAIEKPAALTQKIGAASLNGTAKGSLDKVAFNGTVNALRFAVTGQGTVETPMTSPVINSLQLNVKHAQFSEAIRTFQPGFQAPPSFNGPLDLSTVVAWDKSHVGLSAIKGTLGGTSVSGALDVATGSDKPSVKGDLSFGDLVFDATKSGGSSSGGAGGSAPANTARWSTQPIDTVWMNSMDADLAIKARSITQDQWKLSNANLSFNLNGGTLELRDVSAGMFGGTAQMNGKIKSAPLSVDFTMKADKVDAQKLHSALTGAPADKVSGTISTFNLNVASAGASPSALVNALSGKGDMTGKGIVIKGIDAAQLAETAKGSFKPLERAGSLYNTFQGGQTEFDTMDLAFGIQNGVVNFTTLKLDGPRALIEAKSGNVNLPRWTVDLTTTVTVKDTDIPPFDVTVKGPLDNPLQAGGNVIEGYLRNKAQKKVEKLIGKELEKRFGIPFGQPEAVAPAPADVAPAATGTEGVDAVAPEAPAAEPAPVKKQSKEEKALRALQGILGQ